MQNVQYAPMLFLPSLRVNDDIITIANVCQDEASSFVKHFDSEVTGNRKLKANASATADHWDVLSGNLNLLALVDDESLGQLVERLSKSDIVGSRGRRAVFVDVENDVLAVGTTVVYNQNWAMLGVSDPSVMTTVLEAVTAAADEYE